MLRQHPREHNLARRGMVLVRNVLEMVDEFKILRKVFLREARQRPPVVVLFKIFP
jgi:hypothetical protein